MALIRLDVPKKERRAFRICPNSAAEVRIKFTIDDVPFSVVVDEIGILGARLVTVKHFDRFHEGQALELGTLFLENIGTVNIAAIVKWKSYPRIGIEFGELTVNNQDKLFRYLFKASRQAIRNERLKKENGRAENPIEG